MNISPLDIRKHEFKKSFRGYDVDEVLSFLDLVSMEMENLIRENSSLKERGQNVDSQLKKYHDIENTLRETLLSAQKAREETIDSAKRQADVIIREAEVKAASIVDEGRRDLSRVRGTLAELKMQKDNYLIKVRSMVKAQLEILENVDFPEDLNVAKAVEPDTQQAPASYMESPEPQPQQEYQQPQSQFDSPPQFESEDNNPLEEQI